MGSVYYCIVVAPGQLPIADDVTIHHTDCINHTCADNFSGILLSLTKERRK